MNDWLGRMFDPAGFPARWHCGEWTDFLGWLHITSDVVIWLAYMGIPAVLFYLVRHRRDLPFLPVFWLFILFIASCGIGHLVEATMFWWPVYRFSGTVKLVTALVSIATLIALVPFARRALAMPGTTHLLAQLRTESAEHGRRQEELRLSQEHLRLATLASGVGIWSWRADGDRLALDANTRDMLGLAPRPDEDEGKDLLIGLVHPGDRADFSAQLRASVEKGTPLAASFRLVRSDGVPVQIVARGSPQRDNDGRILGIAGAFFDVTREELSRELFRIAVEASPNALLIVDHKGDIVLANTAAENVFGYSRASLAGMSVDRLVPPHVQPGHAALRASYMAAPGHRRLGAGRDLAGLRKDGSEVPLEIALAPLQLAGGPGVLAAIVDITERKELQTKLSQAERLAAVGELAAGVAHEINNPLNTMINCAQLVLDGDPPAENCRTVIEEGARITAIVRDLLQFAREDPRDAQATSLPEVISRCVRLLGENLKRHGIDLEIDVPTDVPPLRAHPQQLQQVLLNLLINAKEALQGQRDQAHRRIVVLARAGGDNAVECAVRDNGPGIPPGLRARIFEPFVTTKRARGGTGLGLSVSRSIITAFGGTIDVRSVPGELTEFRFVLPRA